MRKLDEYPDNPVNNAKHNLAKPDSPATLRKAGLCFALCLQFCPISICMPCFN